MIIKLHSLLGNKWSLIAGRLPGRTDNEIKNYWNTHIRRKLLSRGIDPVTHKPIINNNAPQDDDHDDDDDDHEIGRKEQCPDLNLELRMSPLHDHPIIVTSNSNSNSSSSSCTTTTTTTSTVCFCSRLGLQNTMKCCCSSSSEHPQFLGMKTGVLDYRTLNSHEMK
ncbi:hypothetical protein Syun_015815 [Stephania yunnanensis]|uniref:Uncharacterized protein n=1 Tax=Stephania yunnanensis TaxID=152371 RepID=A0AAP0JP43_9MAGN